MFRILTMVSLFALLAACGDGQPFEFGDPDNGGGTPEPPAANTVIPTELAVNLFDLTYNPDGANGAGTLLVDLRSLDASVFNASYIRDPSRDIDGYRAFEYREDANGNGRKFLAFVREAPSGSVMAAVVADGGQFNRYFGGDYYAQSGTYSEPAGSSTPNSGVVRYSGSYAGIITVDTSGAVDYTGVNPLPNGNHPFQPSAVRGDALIIADFTNNTVNGGIVNRTIISEDGVTVLPSAFDLVDLALTATDIETNGEFFGEVEPGGATSSGATNGFYGGTFGGVGATDVAGVIVVNPYPNDSDTWEHGVFVFQTCTDVTCPDPD